MGGGGFQMCVQLGDFESKITKKGPQFETGNYGKEDQE